MKLRHKQSANIAIEMAFILPTFLIFLLGAIEVNRYFWTGYWLDYNLYQAIKDEAWEPGIGVETRLTTGLNGLLIDTKKLSLNENTHSLGNLLLTEYRVSYKTRFYFLPSKEFSFHSTSWVGDNENDII